LLHGAVASDDTSAGCKLRNTVATLTIFLVHHNEGKMKQDVKQVQQEKLTV
jgi:D-Tyr-tRNAtyr deacylase